ncbi:hypothetical protein GCM10007853_19340 [Algimonas ampicilliniresistens]|uniref:Uncharacterized protein n=1 Tax=Algimonas ampicilliniresistens TaxID=1298735 RepID=A0ABQ5V9E4_9PROT|nr:hypothetical protein GCM10007853_19340 [Algimonas ampicilliniresistens]
MSGDIARRPDRTKVGWGSIEMKRERIMSESHTLSHLITFALLGGITITLACLLLHSGGGLYA